ncbi:hypothetical protein B0H14DRAFT_499493 [Mycena olivaceomarginata]|nr:hypothetical protein B0H14DRAFT_499493 [Mycena olivaceomarginata]
MKCDFGPGGSGSPGTGDPTDNTCRRCRAGGHVCIVEGRKPRSAPNPAPSFLPIRLRRSRIGFSIRCRWRSGFDLPVGVCGFGLPKFAVAVSALSHFPTLD